MKNETFNRLVRRLPHLFGATLVILVTILWVDSLFNPRKLFVKTLGDIRMGFESSSGFLSWIEQDPWYPPGQNAFGIWTVPFSWIFVLAIAWWVIAAMLLARPGWFKKLFGIALIVATCFGMNWLVFHRFAAAKSSCIGNLKQLESAKEQWALENKKKIEDVPAWDDLVGPGKFLHAIPRCPKRGHYYLNSIASPPTCSLGPPHTLEFYLIRTD